MNEKLKKGLEGQGIAPNVPNPPHCPMEFVKALRRQGLRVNLPGPPEARMNNDLETEGWLGKRPEDKK